MMAWMADDETDGKQFEEDTNLFEDQRNAVMDRFVGLQYQRLYQRLILFWYTLIILLRFMKGFRGQPRVAMIAETLKFASIDLVHFLIIFGAVFISFAIG